MLRTFLVIGLLMPLTACTPWFTEPDDNTNGRAASSKTSSVQKTSSASSFDESAYFPLSDAEKKKVATHIGGRINTYVTTPPDLGGKYYVTDIQWHSGNTAIVTYEDGHTRGKARATATIQNGEVEVLQFVEFFSQ